MIVKWFGMDIDTRSREHPEMAGWWHSLAACV
jgi:hypothetical protein